MHTNETITISRDCDAVLIPAGDHLTLKQGTMVFITQSLGGNYTVNVNGNLAQISAKDADALGIEITETTDVDKATIDDDGAVNEDAIWDLMKTCYDPEIPVNIVELGLIYDCKISPLEDGGNKVDIVMTLTAPGCGMGEFLAEDVRSKIANLSNVTDVNVELTFDPPWSQDMMSEAARLEVGLY